MPLNKVLLTGTYLDGSGSPLTGTAIFTPSAPLTDATDSEVVLQSPVAVAVNSSGQFSVQLYATDNANLVPSGWVWNITENIAGLGPSAWSFFLPYAGGSTQDISSLTPAVPVAEATAYLPESGGTMSGTLALAASPPIALPSGSSGYVLASDSEGDLTLQPLTLTDSGLAIWTVEVSTSGALSTLPVMQDEGNTPIADQAGELIE